MTESGSESSVPPSGGFAGKLREGIKKTGRGVYSDIRARLPYYYSDWRDGLTYRVIPSTIFMYFTNLLPAIAFAQDMFDRTDNSYGVNEVLLASAIAGISFGLLSGQPLCIVGVTGPISIFNYTVYDILKNRHDGDLDTLPYFQFMCWICLWAMVLHVVLAITNSATVMRFISMYSCNVFGFFINVIYLGKAIEILIHQFGSSYEEMASGYLSVIVALLVGIVGLFLFALGSKTRLFNQTIRNILADYYTPFSVVFFSAFVHFGGYMSDTSVATLPITKSFQPTSIHRDGWFIRFWEGITVGDVFLALPFGILLTFLFFFDHNVSSLMCQGPQFPLKKPAAFHWDLFLLGITTGISGLIGIPAPNGLIPQAPLHTTSLCVYETHDIHDQNGQLVKSTTQVSHVVEQRVTNTAQGLLILGTMSRPLLIVLHQIPQGVLSGLFILMGLTGLIGNSITLDVFYRASEAPFVPQDHALAVVKRMDYKYDNPRRYFDIFLGLELLGAAAEIVITLTRAAIGFPVIVVVLAVFATLAFPRIFPPDILPVLDRITAGDLILSGLVANYKPNSQSQEDSDSFGISLSQLERQETSDSTRRRRRSAAEELKDY